MDTELSTLRRTALYFTIGSFAVAALLGVVALLSGGEFGETQGKVLLTTLVVGCASICALCYLATGSTPYAWLGALGGIVLVVPVSTSMYLIWSDWDLFDGPGEAVWKSFGVGIVAAVTLAQVALLLGLAWARRSLGWLLWSTIALAGALAVLVGSVIIGEIEAEGVWRIIGVVAILDVLGTLVTSALAKFTGARRGAAPVATTGPPANGLTVALTHDQAARIEQLSRETGRSPAHLVAEAVDRYLG